MRDISYILSPTPEVPFTVVGGYLYGTNIYHTMSRIFHFGDSYAGTGMIDKHFVHHISKKINYTYCGEGVLPGGSNEQILSKLLYYLMNFKEGDIVFINFSFFTRGCYYDKEIGKIMSTNYYYNDVYGDFKTEDYQKYIMDIISYQLDNNEDYNRRLFYQFDTIFKQLHRMNIPVNYIFIVENEWSDTLLNYGNKISFSTDFYTWLDSNGYHNQEEGHYTRGIQENICDYVIPQLIS